MDDTGTSVDVSNKNSQEKVLDGGDSGLFRDQSTENVALVTSSPTEQNEETVESEHEWVSDTTEVSASAAAESGVANGSVGGENQRDEDLYKDGNSTQFGMSQQGSEGSEEKEGSEGSEESDGKEGSEQGEGKEVNEVSEGADSSHFNTTTELDTAKADDDDDDSDGDDDSSGSFFTLEPSMFATSRAVHWHGRKVSPYLRVMQIPALSPVAIHRQQTLFNSFLQQFSANQTYNRKLGRVIVYKIHKDAGLGNMIRGYITAMAVAILTNRAIQGMHEFVCFILVKAPRDIFFHYFIPPFPKEFRTSSNYFSFLID